jgi:hypothetical protein
MNTSNRNSHQSDKETQAFDPPLIHEEISERPEPENDEKESAEELKPEEVEENREQTQVVTKEAMLRVSRGQL